ncbi:hypothetical protein WJX73_007664 [Symbiochloris irregularis]|uniref:Uncharacterized protein n=1 Tax=Symbiochloris irregularis TaxID=706552 RepID=A0AAW1P0M9_9CHLO
MSDLDVALKDAERLCKRQKACSAKTHRILSNLLQDLCTTRDLVRTYADPGDARRAVEALHERFEGQGPEDELSHQTKDLHSSISKLGKALDKAFVPDVCKAARDIEFDQPTLNKVIAEHLFRVGRFEVGETFIREANIPGGEALRDSFRGMHQILQQILLHNLDPALQWVDQNRKALELSNKGFASGAFEFQLHQLQFLHCLSTQGALAAVGYARTHFLPFHATQMPGIQRLMGCLCYTKRPLPQAYRQLMGPDQWDAAAREFARQCCSLLGQAYESPLLVVVSAGSLALPTLLKLAGVMAGQVQDLAHCEQLPVDLELGREFVFSSIFACPVLRDQSSPSNPPMMLPCGHALCAASIDRIAKSRSQTFKCPYCPAETNKAACKRLTFPEEL